MSGRPPLPSTTALAARLRKLRVRRRLRVEDAARAVQVTPATWWDWERGRRSPRLAMLGRIADALGTTAARLID